MFRPIIVRELIARLEALPQDEQARLVVLASDAEGSSYSLLSDGNMDVAYFEPDRPGYGRGEIATERTSRSIPCLVLYPV